MCTQNELAELATILAGSGESIVYDAEQDRYIYKSEKDTIPFDKGDIFVYLRMRKDVMRAHSESLGFWSTFYERKAREAERYLAKLD